MGIQISPANLPILPKIVDTHFEGLDVVIETEAGQIRQPFPAKLLPGDLENYDEENGVFFVYDDHEEKVVEMTPEQAFENLNYSDLYYQLGVCYRFTYEYMEPESIIRRPRKQHVYANCLTEAHKEFSRLTDTSAGVVTLISRVENGIEYGF
ncbi:hypothetical protein [Lewinella sp. W8]|uniref:hypothetical protein n=1 Tax=Lewinella sp. W8 TaxID=2528208 RepID=UPI0010682042|nr:hypothetical protein [Lewinella sp. W8]MTB53065.1 hypothetical protein [Lewinella sp. W8]